MNDDNQQILFDGRKKRISETKLGSEYRNVAVSGLACDGTTTLAQRLAEILGWKYVNSGEVTRQFARSQGIELSNAALRSVEFERGKDDFMLEKLKSESHWVVEGWLSGWVARNLQDVLRVRLYAPLEVRIYRCAKRDGLSLSAAREEIKKRYEANLKAWKQIYGTENFWDPSYFQLQIDSHQNGKEACVRLVLEALGFDERFA